MSNAVEAMQGLEQASQKHEKEIVIEFGLDRILHYVGVYLVAFLAVVAKISELAGTNLSCHPTGNASTSADFIKYATSYCWDSSQVMSDRSLADNNEVDACELANSNFSETKLLENPSVFMSFIQWVPYGMILEALLFAVPSIWWHFGVGGKLMGHLKFMKLLLHDIYEAVKPIPTGVYRTGDSYDSESRYLNGWQGYKPDYDKDKRDGVSKSESSLCFSGFLRRRLAEEKKNDETGSLMELGRTSPQQPPSGTVDTKNKVGWFARALYGEMRDRHLFSMLCFENFSSMVHHPYILSVYKLSKKEEKASEKGFIGSKTKGILRLLCNDKNFGGHILVKTYLQKHIFGTVVSLLAMASIALVLTHISAEGWNTESFRCDIIYHMDVCMICTIRRKRDMVAYLAVNLVVTFLYFLLSLLQWIFIRTSAYRATSYYFREISDTGSVALNRAG